MKNTIDHITKLNRTEPSPFIKIRILAALEQAEALEKPRLQWGVVLVIFTLFFSLNLVAITKEKQSENDSYIEYSSITTDWYAQ
jgi:hypothetical protein